MAFLQTLIHMEENEYLKHVNEYWGTSAGALVASLLAIGQSPAKLKSVMWKADFTKFRNVDIANILNIMNTWGLDDGTSLQTEIERLFELMKPGSPSYLMRDLVGLNIVVSDLNVHKSIVCNSETYPELRVTDVIRASMSLPIFLKPFQCPINNHYWVDGGIRANFPWHLLPNDDARSTAIGFNFTRSWDGGPKSFAEYLFSMIHFDEPQTIQRLKKEWPNNIIWFSSPPFPAWFVKFTPDDYTFVETLGSNTYHEWVKSTREPLLNLKKNEILVQTDRLRIPPLVSLPDHTIELSDTPPVSPELFPDSSRLQSPPLPPLSRRWSL